MKTIHIVQIAVAVFVSASSTLAQQMPGNVWVMTASHVATSLLMVLGLIGAPITAAALGVPAAASPLSPLAPLVKDEMAALENSLTAAPAAPGVK